MTGQDVSNLTDQLAGNIQRSKNIWLDLQKDFGAKGDGVTDDTLAIAERVCGTQVDYGSVKLYIPEGTYLTDQDT
jgi:hypothetical protein